MLKKIKTSIFFVTLSAFIFVGCGNDRSTVVPIDRGARQGRWLRPTARDSKILKEKIPVYSDQITSISKGTYYLRKVLFREEIQPKGRTDQKIQAGISLFFSVPRLEQKPEKLPFPSEVYTAVQSSWNLQSPLSPFFIPTPFVIQKKKKNILIPTFSEKVLIAHLSPNHLYQLGMRPLIKIQRPSRHLRTQYRRNRRIPRKLSFITSYRALRRFLIGEGSRGFQKKSWNKFHWGRRFFKTHKCHYGGSCSHPYVFSIGKTHVVISLKVKKTQNAFKISVIWKEKRPLDQVFYLVEYFFHSGSALRSHPFR